MYARFGEKNGIQITYCFKLLILFLTLLSDSKRNPHLIGIWFICGMVWFRRRLFQLWHVSSFYLELFRLVPHIGSKKQRIANLSKNVCITNKWEVFTMVNHQKIIEWTFLLSRIVISIKCMLNILNLDISSSEVVVFEGIRYHMIIIYNFLSVE